MSKKKPTFEEALKQLEQIAEQIEQGKIGLEDSIAKYEEGMVLVKHCRDILSKAEQRIQQLQTAPDGSPTTSPFELPEESNSPETG